MIANLCQWTEPVKIVNLVTRLKGQALAFYRSCDDVERNDYTQLIGLLKKRFTPVHIQAVQSSLFHDRKQRPGESVDAYAQELRRLFQKAYPIAQRGSHEAESMGKSVLAYQFVTGLRTELKSKVAGLEGSFDALVVKARFEEAKCKEIPRTQVTPRKPPRSEDIEQAEPVQTTERQEETVESGKSGSAQKRICFKCGEVGHIARSCKSQKRANQEASGQRVATLKADQKAEVPRESGPAAERVSVLRRQLREAELSQALEESTTTLHGIHTGTHPGDPPYGKRIETEVMFEDRPVQALVDTGSPVTIVSLKFCMEALKSLKRSDQTPSAWQTEVRKRLQEPSTTLQGYGGGTLNIVCQLEATIRRGVLSKTSTVYVQSDATVDLLLGTDYQPNLGLQMLVLEPNGKAVELSTGRSWPDGGLPYRSWTYRSTIAQGRRIQTPTSYRGILERKQTTQAVQVVTRRKMSLRLSLPPYLNQGTGCALYDNGRRRT